MYERKERLFKTRDCTKWGYTQGPQDELLRRQEELIANKDKAFKFMLSEDTQSLEYQREELSFYTNQCLDETRRVGKDNGRLLSEHFIEMSQVICAYINQVSEVVS